MFWGSIMKRGNDEKSIKRMAELLRKGATLTELACPNCASPLFRLNDGTLWCEKDEKQVIVVKPEESQPSASNDTLSSLEVTLLTKIRNVQGKIQETENVEELQRLSSALSELLENLAKIRKMRGK